METRQMDVAIATDCAKRMMHPLNLVQTSRFKTKREGNGSPAQHNMAALGR
jgi:hypothetical protein